MIKTRMYIVFRSCLVLLEFRMEQFLFFVSLIANMSCVGQVTNRGPRFTDIAPESTWFCVKAEASNILRHGCI